MRKRPLFLLPMLLCLLLAGCGSGFEKEYVSVTNYNPPALSETDEEERVTVRNMAELKKAIIDMVYDGSAGGNIAFDPNYDGSAPEDMESACWQVRTQDALCAYCVRDLRYDLKKIVNYYESALSIEYTAYSAPLSEIIHLPYSVGLQDILSAAMEENQKQLTILIDASSTSMENVKSTAIELYRKNPTICVREPQLTVYVYSGAGRQRLYEINFRYGMSDDEISRCKELMNDLDVEEAIGARELDDLHKAFAACRYLTENCQLSESSAGSCYDALICGESNSEGLALAYVEMCHRLGIDCRIVFELGGGNHCWNIVKLDRSYYHVDVSRCCEGEFENGFLLNDEQMWNDHRWNISSYPSCRGELSYADVAEEPSSFAEPFAEGETESGKEEPTAPNGSDSIEGETAPDAEQEETNL